MTRLVFNVRGNTVLRRVMKKVRNGSKNINYYGVKNVVVLYLCSHREVPALLKTAKIVPCPIMIDQISLTQKSETYDSKKTSLSLY